MQWLPVEQLLLEEVWQYFFLFPSETNGLMTASGSCQKAKWPKHKPFCNMVQGKGAKNAYLTAYPRDEALRVLIDSYRLRVELDHVHRHEDHGMYYPGKWEEGLV